MATNDESLGDDAVEEAYRNADIVTLCSTEEGFGLPIIEGQAKGTVVITSDREPMRDVAGDGAMLVDPERVDSIRDGIRKVIADHGLRARLIGAGRLNVKRFAPQRVAGEYFDLYSTILEESRTA